MKRWKWLLLAVTLLPSLALATSDPKVMTTPPILVRVAVDATGHLTDITPMQKLADPFAGIVQRTLAKWTFYPARINGKPVVTMTWLNIKLKAQLNGNGGAQVQVDYLGNGPYWGLTCPPYPWQMARELRAARIVVEATVGTDGHLADPKVVAALTSDGGPAKFFVRAVLNSVRKAKAKPIVVDGQPVVSHVRFPVTFALDVDGRTDGDAAHFRPASDSSRYVTASQVPPPASRLALVGNEMVALDSPIQPIATPGG